MQTHFRELELAHRELISLKQQVLAARADEKFAAFLLALKENFNPDQPRDELGRWTSGGGASAQYDDNVIDNESASSLDGAEYIAAGSVNIDYSKAYTGDPRIDRTTRTLSETLGNVMEKMDFIPTWTPQMYGTAVHTAFGWTVRGMGIEGIGYYDVEQSFRDAGPIGYGAPGSIRTDVVLRDDTGQTLAIYDVKTGNAEISPARARDIRSNAGVVDRWVPIIELNVIRGASIKSRPAKRIIGHVIARLYRDRELAQNLRMVRTGGVVR
ncbi:hypothetical protein GJW-30_1_04285 [Variibacter gotjawalensis]|uniref:Uncharacterized protein n=1 Tax=Variibacter gotjawalensis TaxID=1333996 RepID=A0A0S3Q0J9_9BRAD|nr:hypothetical protein [Variibacter gotjawalensis]NIK47564.1 hypothetical protein [Variibacter gotjawalensis]RZS49461.1 hypothetical protein EV661_1895 [Variibacter gotjawalensis]BAT61724.1 hypothetical protein GJW-30_1_04285 [Variibacter gotjawalensis]